MIEGSPALWLLLSIGGIAGGLGLLWRGMGSYRTAVALGDTSTSSIDSLAAGEVRVTGHDRGRRGDPRVAAPEPGVRVVQGPRADADHEGGDIFAEERAVGFRVRDAGGTIRVFPRGARVGGATAVRGQDGRLRRRAAGGLRATLGVDVRAAGRPRR